MAVDEERSELPLFEIRRFWAIGNVLSDRKWHTFKEVSEVLEGTADGRGEETLRLCVDHVEHHFGRELIERRTGRGCRITARGEEVLRLFEDVIESFDRVQSRDLGGRRTVRVAAPNFITLHGLSQVLPAIALKGASLEHGNASGQLRRRPRHYAVVESSSFWNSVTLLRDGIVDLAIECTTKALQTENVQAKLLPESAPCEFSRVVLIPKKDGSGHFRSLPGGDQRTYITLRDLEAIPLVLVLVADQAQRLLLSEKPRIAVDTLEAARRIALSKQFGLLTLNWGPVMGQDWYRDFDARLLIGDEKHASLKTRRARNEGLVHLQESLQVVALHREFPPLHSACISLLEAVDRRFAVVRDKERWLLTKVGTKRPVWRCGDKEVPLFE